MDRVRRAREAGSRVNHAATRLAMRIAEVPRRTLLGVLAIVFLLGNAPILLTMLITGRHLHTLDTTVVLGFMLMATVTAGWIAAVRLPSYRLPPHLRRRENAGWWLIAAGSLLNLVGRIAYATADATTGAGDGIVAADLMFTVSPLIYVAGLLVIPWAEDGRSRTSLLVDGGIIFASVATLLWPVVLGPALQGEITGAFGGTSMATNLAGIVLLMFAIFWIFFRGIRGSLIPVVFSFLLAVMVLMLMQIGAYWFGLDQHYDVLNEPRQLVTNAFSALVFMVFTAAALLRLTATAQPDDPVVEGPPDEDAPVHTWQIVVLYPIIGVLFAVRLSMELFDWQTEYRTEMVAGIVLVAAFMMVRQVQMMKFNHDLFERVSRVAIRDGITGLYNHRSMHDLLHSEIVRADRQSRSCGVLFLDIDRFKQFNDTYGHKEGDRLLVTVSNALSGGSRAGDIVGRYGGEEFMVIAPDLDGSAAMRLGERLRLKVDEQHVLIGEEQLSVSISVGIAMFPEHSDNPERLIDLADQAMYVAKSSGRNRTSVYEPDDGMNTGAPPPPIVHSRDTGEEAC